MNTSIWAILPLRALNNGKQRLSSVLSAAERRALVEHLFRHTLDAIKSSDVIDGVCVVSPDPAVLEWVAPLGVEPIWQPQPGLNVGLEWARRSLLAAHAIDALLVVLPDLPLVRADNITALVQRSTPRSVVLAPDRHGYGTNALLVRPGDAIPFAFGEGSCARHRAAAQRAQLRVHVFDAQGTAFDVDTPDDVEALQHVHVRADAGSENGGIVSCVHGA